LIQDFKENQVESTNVQTDLEHIVIINVCLKFIKYYQGLCMPIARAELEKSIRHQTLVFQQNATVLLEQVVTGMNNVLRESTTVVELKTIMVWHMLQNFVICMTNTIATSRTKDNNG
jgi:hypothetical protein